MKLGSYRSMLNRYIQNSFFPDAIVKWNKLDANLKNAKSYMCFRNSLLKIGRSVPNSIFKVVKTQ